MGPSLARDSALYPPGNGVPGLVGNLCLLEGTDLEETIRYQVSKGMTAAGMPVWPCEVVLLNDNYPAPGTHVRKTADLLWEIPANPAGKVLRLEVRILFSKAVCETC